MNEMRCPGCGEQDLDKLSGKPNDDDVLLSCDTCGNEWVRRLYTCPQCGGSLYDDKRPLYQKSRGVQQSIIGYNTVKICNSCGYTDAVGPPTESRGYTKDDA